MTYGFGARASAIFLVDQRLDFRGKLAKAGQLDFGSGLRTHCEFAIQIGKTTKLAHLREYLAFNKVCFLAAAEERE